MLQAIYDSGLGQSMRESLWGYPISLSVHGIGMGLLVGVLVVVDLRLLGYFRQMPIFAIKPIVGLALFGFVVNFLSGVLLFVADPVAYVGNPAFLIKISGVVVGMGILWLMYRTPEFKAMGSLDATAAAGNNLRVLAMASLVVWAVTIIGGRLIGYTL